MQGLNIRRYPRRPKGHRGTCPAECLGVFSQSPSAALPLGRELGAERLGSFFSVRAGNVSFLKRDPHGRTLSRFKNVK